MRLPPKNGPLALSFWLLLRVICYKLPDSDSKGIPCTRGLRPTNYQRGKRREGKQGIFGDIWAGIPVVGIGILTTEARRTRRREAQRQEQPQV